MLNPESIRFLIAIVPIFFLALGMWKPIYAAIGYMVLVYCKTTNYYPFFGDIHAELIFAVIILLRLLIDKKHSKKLSFANNRINYYLFLFILCIGLSFAISWSHLWSWDHAVYHFIKTAILFYMLAMSLDDSKDIRLLAWSFVLMFAYLAYEPTYGFITKTGGSVHYYGSVYVAEVGPLSGHVALANNMNQMIPIAYFLIFSVQGIYKRAIAAIPLVILVTALIASGSRGGVAGLLFFILILIFLSKQRRLSTILIGGASTLILFTFSTFTSTASRIDTQATMDRFIGLTHGLEMVRFGNIFGVGPGCFALARGYYFGYSMDAHNLYGEVFGELGILGAIVWFFFIREMFLSLIRSKRMLEAISMDKSPIYYLASGLQASLMVRLFISFASHGLYYFYWYVMAAMCAATFVSVKILSDDFVPAETHRLDNNNISAARSG